MSYNVGWQRIYDGDPFVRATIWVDALRREGNRIHYTLNAAFAVDKANGFWDFPWRADIQLGNHVWNGKLIKGSTAWRQVIGGRSYYLSEHNGHFTGSIDVGGQETQLVARLYFRDDKGNVGKNCYFSIPIPRATNPAPMRISVDNITADSATFTGSISFRGDYSTIKKWRIQYKTNDRDEKIIDIDNQDVLSKTFTITNLKPNTRYMYRISALSSSDYWTFQDSTFTTKPTYIGTKVTEEEEKKLSAYIVYSNGEVKRVNKIKRVER